MYFEAFIAETYVQLAATGANVLRARTLRSETPNCYSATANNAALALYCVVLYIDLLLV